MRMAAIRYLIVFLACLMALQASENKDLDTIAKMSATHLYELDPGGLEKTLLPYLREKASIRSLEIIDSAYNESFWTYHAPKEGESAVTEEPFSQQCESGQQLVKAPIKQDGQAIGLLQVCYQPDQVAQSNPSVDTEASSVERMQLFHDIASMSAPYLYELELDELERALLPYLNGNPQIVRLRILDGVDDSLFFSYQRQHDGGLLLGQTLPEKCEEGQTNISGPIMLREEEIGTLQFCTEILAEVSLAPEEQAFLDKHRVIRVHNESSWPPFNFYQFGQARGHSIDLMNLIAEKTGMAIEYVTGPTWDEFLTMARKGDIDVILNVAKSPDREQFLVFTDSYFTPFHGVMAREDSDIHSFEDLLDGKKVALERSFYYHEYFERNHPEVPLYLTDSTLEAIQGVAFGQADAVLGIIPVLNYFQDKNQIKSLKIVANINNDIFEPTPLRIATRKETPELLSIIQKGLAAITPEEMRQLNHRWVAVAPKISDMKKLKLPPRLQKWANEHPVVVVGGEMDWAPFDFVNHEGEHAGLSKDYLDLIAAQTGLEFDVRTGMTWNELLESLKKGDIDLLPAIYKTVDREAFALFTKPYLSITDYYFTREERAKIDDITVLYGQSVAAVKGYGVTEWLKTHHPDLQLVETETILEALRLLESGEVEAFINDNPSTTYAIQQHFISDVKINSIVKSRSPISTHMAVRMGFEPLVEIINLALKNITTEQKSSISNRWMSEVDGGSRLMELNDRERQWLSRKLPITFAVDPGWMPIEAINKESGQYEGMMADFLERISDLTSIEFQLRPTQRWDESEELLREKKVDMLAALSQTEKRKEYAVFSDVTIELSDGVIMRGDSGFISELSDLQGLRVGVPDGTSVHMMLQKDYPDLVITPIRGTLRGIKELSKGNIDAYVGNLEVAGYHIQQQGLFNLKVALRLETKRKLRIGFRKDMAPEAVSIINKALAQISLEERNTIRQRWIGLKVTEEIDYTLLWKIGLAALLIVLLIGYYNYRLKRLVNQKTADIQTQKKELEILIDSFDKNVIFSRTDIDGLFTHVSQALCEISGYDYADLIGEPQEFIRHPDMPDTLFAEIKTLLQQKEHWSGEIKNLRKNGGYYWVHMHIEPDYDSSGRWIGYQMIQEDITDKKMVEEMSGNLEKLVEQRTKELENEREFIDSVMDSQRSIVIATDAYLIRRVNRAFLSFFDMLSLEEFQEKHRNISEFFVPQESDEYLQETMPGGLSWIQHIMRYDDLTHKAVLEWEEEQSTFAVSADSFIFEGEALFVVTLTDITDMEQIQQELAELHQMTQDSIEYASLIQHSLIPRNQLFRDYFADYFTIWHPRNIVGGDIYLFEELRDENECLLMVIDCTGHGVPGAFVTMLVKAIERQMVSKIISSDEAVHPGKLLGIFNRSMKHLLQQDHEDAVSNAGFDGGILYYNQKEQIIRYAGAETPLFLIRDQGMEIVKGDRHSIGYVKSNMEYVFTETEFSVKPGDKIYLSTDGYLDQNGGKKGFPFGKRKFAKLLEEIHEESFADQQEHLLYNLVRYQGDEDRNDDVTVVGVKIKEGK